MRIEFLASVALAVAPAPSAAVAPKHVCELLQALTGSVPQQSVQFRFEGPAGIGLVLDDGSQFTPNPESCDLDDTIGIGCQWKFTTADAATGFYEQMVKRANKCLAVSLTDEAVPIDPADTNPWNPVRRATAGDDAFKLELIEYQLEHYVALNIDPVEYQAAEKR